MKKLAITFLLWICAWAATAQTIIFKGQLWSNNSPVSNYTVLADGQSSTANDAGIFLVTLKSNATQITLQPSDNKYIVVYPQGGKVLLPRDAGLITQIVLQPFKSNVYIDQYLTAFRQLKDSSGKSSQELAAIHQQVNALAKQLSQYNYTSQDLASVRAQQDGKDLTYPVISASLQNFLSTARNVSAAFQYTAAYAFDNHNALEQLVQAINNYNPAYTDLYTNHNIYAQKIQSYWQDQHLATDYGAITDTLLNQVHQQTIYPLNDLKTKINAYFQGQVNNSEKAAVKKQIQDQVNAIIPTLNKELTDIAVRIQDFQEQLKK